MQAAVYKPGSPVLSIVDNYPIPQPKDHEVLLKIQACGVCHTDVFLLSQLADDPRSYIFGHETSGIATKFGKLVDRSKIKEGELYSVLVAGGCARCAQLPSKPSAAPLSFTSVTQTGVGANGGYAEYIAVDKESLVPVPRGVSAVDAAIVANAGVTAYHAVRRTAQVKKGEKVLIMGIGGLGFLAVQIAVHFGATVYALDIRPSSRVLAKVAGAKEAFSNEELDAQFQKGFTVDTVIDLFGTSFSFDKGISALQNNVVLTDFAKGGKFVLVGVSSDSVSFNPLQAIFSEISILPSFYGTKVDMEETLHLIAQGVIRTQVQIEPLSKVNKVLNELRANLVLSRKVVVPPHSEVWSTIENRQNGNDQYDPDSYKKKHHGHHRHQLIHRGDHHPPADGSY